MVLDDTTIAMGGYAHSKIDSRAPSLQLLHSLALKHGLSSSPWKYNAIQVNPKLTFFVMNPAKHLPGTQKRMQPVVDDLWDKNSGLS